MAAELARIPVVQELVDGLNQLTTSRYLCGAALVLSIYDWILLSGDESLTIWQTKWNLPKAIYYFQRIVTLLGLILATFQLTDLRTSPLPNQFCHVYTFVNSLTELLSLFLSNWLLTLRLVALYQRKKWVVWFLYSFLTTSYLTTAGLMAFTLYTYGETIQYSLVFHACGSSTRSPLMPVIFLAPTAFESTIFFLTGLSAWRDAKLMSSPGCTPFLKVLYRDGMICFFVMFGVRIWNVWIYATQPLTSAYMGIYFLWAIMTILSTRVYLNLVFLTRNPIIEETEISNVQFVGSPQMEGIRMHVHTTTFTDVATIGGGRYGYGRRGRGMTLDSTFGIDTTFYPNEAMLDDSGTQKALKSRRESSRPFTSWMTETKPDRRDADTLA